MGITAEPITGRDKYTLVSGDGDGKADATLLIGGDSAKFEPVFHSAKWGGEASLSLNARKLIGSERPTFEQGKVSLELGDEKHVYYPTTDGLEYEIHLGRKPESPVFEFDVDIPGGVEVAPQLAFNQMDWSGDKRVASTTENECFDSEGKRLRYRPSEVVGSICLLINKQNNQYKTGKFAHIMRPQLIAADGQRAWADMSIDRETKKLVIKAPEQWLADALYPVILDPTVGYSSLGATSDDTDNYVLAVSYTVTGAGDANPGTAFCGGSCDSGTASVYAAPYVGGGANPQGKARIGTGSSAITYTTTAGFRSAAITWTSIADATAYWLAIWSNTSGVNNRYDSGSATGYFSSADGVATPPATYAGGGGGSGAFNNRLSIYADYTASGGGGGKLFRGSSLEGLGAGGPFAGRGPLA